LNVKRLQECRSAASITLHRLKASDGIECDAIVSIEHRVTDPADGRQLSCVLSFRSCSKVRQALKAATG
jgi:hypothetical protein